MKNCSKRRTCNPWIYSIVDSNTSVGNSSLADLGSVKKRKLIMKTFLETLFEKIII